MSVKIIAVIVLGALLASTGMASARPKASSKVNPSGYNNYYDYAGPQPFQNYYDRSYWNAISPQPWIGWQRDPYAGTIWHGVAPY
jgi:hypothetical protein